MKDEIGIAEFSLHPFFYCGSPNCARARPPASVKEWTGIHEGGNIKKGEKENA
jgi:hypothetical protein